LVKFVSPLAEAAVNNASITQFPQPRPKRNLLCLEMAADRLNRTACHYRARLVCATLDGFSGFL
jgi:hypothetical protein